MLKLVILFEIWQVVQDSPIDVPRHDEHRRVVDKFVAPGKTNTADGNVMR